MSLNVDKSTISPSSASSNMMAPSMLAFEPVRFWRSIETASCWIYGHGGSEKYVRHKLRGPSHVWLVELESKAPDGVSDIDRNELLLALGSRNCPSARIGGARVGRFNLSRASEGRDEEVVQKRLDGGETHGWIAGELGGFVDRQLSEG